MSTFDVAVIGAGLGGLSAAALLSRAGKRVVVVERNDAPGGYAHAFRRGPYTFDPAIHAVPEVEFLENLLRYASVGDRVEFLPVDTLFGVVYPDQRLTFPFGQERVIGMLAERFPGEERGLRAFFGLREQVFREASQLPHTLGPRELDAAVERFPTFFAHRSATLQDVLVRHIVEPRLQALLASAWPYVGPSPARCGFLYFAQALGSLMNGAYYPRGSFQSLVDALVEAIEDGGGELILGRQATRIRVEDGGVGGVEVEDGDTIRAPVVVSNADATHTLQGLVGEANLPRSYVNKLRRLVPSLSAFSIYTATTLDLRALGATHEMFVFHHWDHEASYRDIQEGRPGGMWISIPSLVDPSLAPAGEHTVIMSTLVRHDAADWEVATEPFADQLVDELERVYPGYRESMTMLVPASPLTLQRYAATRDGAAYGWELTPRQTASGRLAHETPIRGLYLSGAWTQQGHGCLRTMVSGEQVARRILRDLDGSDPIPSFRPAHLPSLST